MRALLVFAAASVTAAALPAAPALADHRDHRDRPSVDVRSGSFVSGDRLDRRNRRSGDILYIDREYQGDTLWRADSFNDWWHDSPNRSFPRWMQNNANCERKWWGADALRC